MSSATILGRYQSLRLPPWKRNQRTGLSQKEIHGIFNTGQPHSDFLLNRREKRIVELLRLHLCQAIRTTAEEDSRDQRVSTSLANQMETQNPLVRISKDSRIVDQNSKFRNLFRTQPGDRLGSSLARFLEDGIRDAEDSSNTQTSTNGANWYCLCPNVYRVELSPSSDDLWLLELNQLSGACPAFNPVLKQYGLTPKEKEICCRVRQGFDNQEIASQLFISVHTAKTHLKNIYKKLDISNRPHGVRPRPLPQRESGRLGS